MYNRIPYKTKQFLLFLIKIAIIVGAFYFIYQKTVHNEQIGFDLFISQLESTIFKDYQSLIFLLGFTFFNFLFEFLKWRNLVSVIQSISITNAARQSLGSLTASLFTPNRIGEYGAKAIYFKKGKRRKIMLLNLIGNMSQMTITLFFGGIGLWYFLTHYPVEISFLPKKRMLFVYLFLLISGITGYRGVKKIRGFYIDKIKAFLKSISSEVQFMTIAYSLIRYLIFSHQFYFLLRIFDIPIDYISAMSLISSMYFIASIIPSLSFFDWLIKGSVAIWVFSFTGANELPIISITLLMWGLNFGLPAIVGSYFVLNFSIKTQEE